MDLTATPSPAPVQGAADACLPPMPECDLLMKGGVTSGIVYPQLVERLARDYRLRHIGGTSAGAIAAAAAAAAELGRQSGANPDAFAALGRLPAYLGRSMRGRSRLLHLFQPAPALRPAFEMGLALMAAPGAANAFALLLANILHPLLLGIFIAAAVVGMQLLSAMSLGSAALSGSLTAVPVALALFALRRILASGREERAAMTPKRSLIAPADWLGALSFGALAATVVLHALVLQASGLTILRALAALLAGAALFGLWSAWRWLTGLAAAVRDNHFGVCSGSAPGARHAALTDWLEGYLAELAGLEAGTPLTFGHLWTGNAQGVQTGAGCDWDRGQRRIHLEMMTTALSQHTAYAVPFRSNAGSFYFAPSEWARLFPAHVLDWLRASAQSTSRRHPVTGEALVPLVRDGRLPVIVGVRMSLSFPVLLSAVPMFALDRTDPEGEQAAVKRVWFTDGGVTSNLPLQAFDELLPARPVFTINLKPEHPAYPIGARGGQGNGRVFLPQNNRQGIARYWKPFDESGPFALGGFMMALVDTMQRWRDEVLFPYPAYRGRIAQISLRDSEGGLNLAMSRKQIRELAESGQLAGEMVWRRFHPTSAQGLGWPNHQRLALLNLLGSVEKLALDVDATPDRAAWSAALAGGRLNGAQRQAADTLLDELAASGARIRAGAKGARLAKCASKPHTRLRITPEL